MPYDPTSEADIATAIQMARQPQQNFGDASDNAMMRQMVAGIGKPIPPAEPYEMGDTMAAMTQRGRRDISTGSATQADVKAGYPANTIIPQMSEEDRAKMREAAWQKLSGFGSTLYNAAASAIPEVLPSFVVGEPWQRKQLAEDIGAMPDAFAGMGSAIVGPSYERAANMSRKAMFPAGEEAITAALKTAQAVPETGMLGVAEPAPAMSRGRPMESKKTAPEGTFDVDPYAKLTPEDLAIVKKFGKRNVENQTIIKDTLARMRKNYDTESGFAPFEVTGGTWGKTKTGQKTFVPNIQKQAYEFNVPPAGMDKDTWAEQLSDKVVGDVTDTVNKAMAGDKAAQDIVKEARWYRAMRERMRGEFGGMGDLFADLLGTTSAQTGVTQNWNNAIEILRRFSRGDFDGEIAAYEARLKSGQSTGPVELQKMSKVRQERIAAEEAALAKSQKSKNKKKVHPTVDYGVREGEFPLIRSAAGALFNANSPAATRALLDLFRNVGEGVSPKTPNFTGNLIGYSTDATVDVWAARHLRELAGRDTIPPAAEQAVEGAHEAGSTLDNPIIGGEFGFGQDVYKRAVNKLNKSNVINAYDPELGQLGPDDLQAIAWFLQKKKWTDRDWTSLAGEGGSLDFEANLAGAVDPARVKELRKIINASPKKINLRVSEKPESPSYLARVAAEAERNTAAAKAAEEELGTIAAPLDLWTLGISRERPNKIPSNYEQAELAAPLDNAVRDDKAVIGYNLSNTLGLFEGKTERALNAEFTTTSAFNPDKLWRAVLEAGKEYEQDSVFISKVLKSPEDSPNARPGVAIYFRKKQSPEFTRMIADKLVERGLDGFTFITDARQSDRVNVQTLSGSPDTGSMVGVRFQYIPEFDSSFDPLRRAEIMAEKQSQYSDILAELANTHDEISDANILWYDTRVGFNGGYDEELARIGKRYGGEVRLQQSRRTNDPQSNYGSAVGQVGSGAVYNRISRAAGQNWQDADIQAALNTARQSFEGGGVAIPQSKVDEGIIAANQSLQELRGAKQAVRDQAFDEYASNRSWPEYASDVGRDLSAMKDIGLAHDIIPGAIQSVKQAATWPQREAQARASGAPFTPQQSIEEAVNAAGMFTLGAGAVPAEANALRTGFTSRVAKTADLNAIRKAESMSLKGYSPEEIWQKTGYFPHPGTLIEQQHMGKPAKMVRYEQPVNFHVDVEKLKNAPTPDYKYMLPEVFNDDALFAAYPNPDYFKNVPVYARATKDDAITPREGARVHPMQRGIGFFLQNTIDPAIIEMGDLSHPNYQMTKGEVGVLPHEINHIIEDIEFLPKGLPSDAGVKMMSDAFSDVLKRKNLSPADKAYYSAASNEFDNYAKKNPTKTNYALYLHNASEAMSRLAELFASRPELRKNFPLEHLDVNPDWMSTSKETGQGFQITSDPMKALEAVRWAFTPEGTAALKAYSEGTNIDMGISRQHGPYRASGGYVHDPVSSALRLAHEASQ